MLIPRILAFRLTKPGIIDGRKHLKKQRRGTPPHAPKTKQFSVIIGAVLVFRNRAKPTVESELNVARAFPFFLERLKFQMGHWWLSLGRRKNLGMGRGLPPHPSKAGVPSIRI
jgi:hypothetical protein